jgi:hypothetical protein
MIFRESCPYQPRRSRPKGFVNCHGRATPRRPRYAHGPGLVRRKLGGGSSNHNDARRIWRVARAAGRTDRPNRMLVLGWGAAVWLDAMRCDAARRVATKRTHWTGCARGRVRANVHANVCPPALRRPLARCLFSSGCGPRPRPREGQVARCWRSPVLRPTNFQAVLYLPLDTFGFGCPPTVTNKQTNLCLRATLGDR